MPATRQLALKKGDSLVLVGTMKGAFLLRGRGRTWEQGGPFFPGQAVYAMAYDGRSGKPRLWASTGSMHWGSVLRRSDDLGRTWTNPKAANVKFPADTGLALKQIWQIAPGRGERARRPLLRGRAGVPLRVATTPARPGRSCAASTTTRTAAVAAGRRRALPAHGPARTPRTGTACSSPSPPAASTAPNDGGPDLAAQQQGRARRVPPRQVPRVRTVRAQGGAPPVAARPAFPAEPLGPLPQRRRGANWKDIANGVPSDFGFAMAVHPHEPDTAYIVPLESDEFRCTPDGRLRVYRTRNAGGSWQASRAGFPRRTRSRPSSATRSTPTPAIPRASTSGRGAGSCLRLARRGEELEALTRGLPPVVCVKAAVVGSA